MFMNHGRTYGEVFVYAQPVYNLNDKAQSAVLFNGVTGELFRATVGVRQVCLLSLTLFNILLKRTMCEALDDL